MVDERNLGEMLRERLANSGVDFSIRPRQKKPVVLYRDQMSTTAKATFVHEHGMDAFLRLPARPDLE